MTSVLGALLLCSFGLLAACPCVGQRHWDHISTDGFYQRDSLTRGDFTLILINKDSAFDHGVKERMTDAFFKVYPAEVRRFKAHSLSKVIFVIDPGYKGVAATSGGIVRYNPEWFRKHPGDIDVVTHEVMHIVQAYPSGAGPGWLTEGIADYVRYAFGVDNEGAGWSMPDYNERQNYDNSYRITARFLAWLDKHVRPGIVDSLDAAMRSKTYTDGLWKSLTGSTVAELWARYGKSPAL